MQEFLDEVRANWYREGIKDAREFPDKTAEWLIERFYKLLEQAKRETNGR